MDLIERDIYSVICSNDGIKARQIGKQTRKERSVINHYLYSSPFMKELCYADNEYNWHGLIRQAYPHFGLGEFCGYYSLIKEFMELDEQIWLEQLKKGCQNVGRNLNDTRGLFHSFIDERQTIRTLVEDTGKLDISDWEIAFELRINKSKFIRIYSDVLLIGNGYVFSLEFKMKDIIQEEEVSQAAKYCEYLEVIFGPDYNVIPVLVLTRATDLFKYVELENSTAQIPVVSGDMLFNILDEYIGIY